MPTAGSMAERTADGAAKTEAREARGQGSVSQVREQGVSAASQQGASQQGRRGGEDGLRRRGKVKGAHAKASAARAACHGRGGGMDEPLVLMGWERRPGGRSGQDASTGQSGIIGILWRAPSRRAFNVTRSRVTKGWWCAVPGPSGGIRQERLPCLKCQDGRFSQPVSQGALASGVRADLDLPCPRSLMLDVE